MANKLPAGISASLEVTFDTPGLFVAFDVYDDSGLIPVFIQRISALNFNGNSYRAKFLGQINVYYLIKKLAFLDPGFTQPASEPEGSESIVFVADSSSEEELIAVLEQDENLSVMIENEGLMAALENDQELSGEVSEEC